MENETISYYVHEEQMCRQDIHNKRLFILCLIMFIALILTNGAWLYHESMYEDIRTEQEITSDGNGDIAVSGVGDINYGNEDKANSDNTP